MFKLTSSDNQPSTADVCRDGMIRVFNEGDVRSAFRKVAFISGSLAAMLAASMAYAQEPFMIWLESNAMLKRD
jgi:hypothetical protein